MKNLITIILAGLTAGWFAVAVPAVAQTNDTSTAAAPDPNAQPADQVAAPSADQTNTAPATAAAPVGAETPLLPEYSTNSTATSGTADKGLVVNIRNASVDTVLNYLSAAAGYTIVREANTRVNGTVDIVSATPVSKEHIVSLLNDVLAKNGLTAVPSMDNQTPTLTLMTLDEATTSAQTPVMVWDGNYTNIPADAKVATWVLPLHSLNPTQVAKDLFPLRPPNAEINANEGGNALIMTGAGTDVRRFAEIIQALDSSGNGDLEVYLLNYADSKSIAQELKDVFNPQDATGQGGNPFAQIFGRGRGGGGGGGGGFGGGGGAAGEDNPKRAAIHVNAVSDDQNNAVLVSAPADIMPGISNIISKLDVPQEDTVQIRVFGLHYADCTDVANELAALFPDPSTQATQQNTTGRRAGPQYLGAAGGGFRGGGGGGGGGAASSMSDRLKKQATVIAVPDPRTQSVIVTASKDTMDQIKAMIDELDGNPAHRMQIYVYRPLNGDVSDFYQPLKDLFGSTTTSTSTQPVSALQQRITQNAQNQTTQSTLSGTTGGGGGGGTSGLR